MHNPSLTQESRYEPAKVVPLPQEPDMLEWLKTKGKLIKRDPDEKFAPIEAGNIDLLEIEGEFYDTDDEGDDDFELDDDEA